MLHIYFKQTMDHFGVQGTELAEAFGCSRNHISEIRTGKVNPGIDRFWKLLETMDKLAPGSKKYFASLMTNDISDTIESMDNEQLSEILFKVSQALKQKRESHAKKVEQFLTAS
jgi:transcriptional regulator with XRE-family HTH domain